MSNFKVFKDAVQKQFLSMAATNLYQTDVDKDDLWSTYLGSFPEGTNPVFRERTEHDCQCCKQFIRAAGNIISLDAEFKMVSIWDVELPDDDHGYQTVADAMAKFVKRKAIRDVFLSEEIKIGTDYNFDLKLESKWEHFFIKVPMVYQRKPETIGGVLSELRSRKEVLMRGLMELTSESITTALELIAQGSIYRGDEHKAVIERFKKLKTAFGLIPSKDQNNFCWEASKFMGVTSKFRNTAIGTLLIDLSEGIGLDAAVGRFEMKMYNYKRPSPIITKSMVDKANKRIVELGIEDALLRRHATVLDITVDNVKFADRSAKESMGVLNCLSSKVVTKKKQNLDKVEEVGIQTFIKDILPQANTLELLFENKHENNLMSLVAPVNPEAPGIMKWKNNFSWTYNKGVTDSMKERVVKAGGRVEGVLRFTLQWNDGDNNQNDFDAHCIEPNGNVIYFENRCVTHPSSGSLDVDIINPGNEVAVENIIHTDLAKMPPGKYAYLVHNYTHSGGRTGFTAELEFGGQIYSYAYNKELREGEKVGVVVVNISDKKEISIVTSLPSAQASKEHWGVKTCNYQKVVMVMNSPNHWDGNETGNKHYFFILEDCLNPDKVRGFFNEYLIEDLREERKVFEVLGAELLADVSDNQLSGLGFSSTKRNHVFCKVTGAFTRTIKIIF